MIYRLRKKFIKICTLSFILVLLCILAFLLAFNIIQNNRIVDTLTDIIAENDGSLPDFDTNASENPPLSETTLPPENNDIFNADTKFTTRFFMVELSADGTAETIDLSHISSMTEETAAAYAEKAAARSRVRGWISVYRYKRFETTDGKTAIVFVNGSMFRAMTGSNLVSTVSVFLVSSVAVMTLIILISKKAVRPAAESYEKQKQFITDVNHELKTPLTLILTDVDIAESEAGRSEWLDDIRSEGQRMSDLVNQLVVLTRMDEQRREEIYAEFCLSDAIADTVSEFQNLAAVQHKTLTNDLQDDIRFMGDEAELRRLSAILLDNAIKYCDPTGTICVTLKTRKGKRRIQLTVENTCSNVHQLELERLFDRFYRADKVRSAGGGFGIGLSIAKSIVEKYGGDISAHRGKGQTISFLVRL